MQQAAGSGHPYARYNLLQIQESQGMPFNTLMAAYKELAEEGIIHAQLKLMRSLHDGGRHEEALQWAYMAAAQHHPQALYFLAQHHQYASPPDFARHICFTDKLRSKIFLQHIGSLDCNINWDREPNRTSSLPSFICAMQLIAGLLPHKPCWQITAGN